MGGSGKRSLPMACGIRVKTIGKLRRLRLPLPPIFSHVHMGGEEPKIDDLRFRIYDSQIVNDES